MQHIDERIYRSFTDLEVWQKARLFKNEMWELTKSFPQEEKYRQTDQLARSTRSIGSNIAEGYGRYAYKQQTHFCRQARGSLFETLNHLTDAKDCGYISEDIFSELGQKVSEAEKLLNGYIAWLRKMTNTKMTVDQVTLLTL